MGLTITNNVASLNAENNLSRTSSMLSKSLERLSSGLKINRGADGPAALVISEQQRAQIAGLKTAIDNTSKAVSMVQTTEGALNEINSLLVKVRSLALDSANSGVNDSNALAANQAEVANALSTIDRIAANTQFGRKKVLDGSAGLTGSTDDTDVTFLKASTSSPTGSFAVAITTAAQRANTTAGTAQSGALAADETLTVNGVAIKLTAGQTQAQVISTSNTYSGQTGVTAEVGAGSATRLRTSNFGSNAKITVQSNVAAAATSSGFGTAQTSVTGVDVAGTLGGFAATGNGNVLSGSAGAGAAGISVSLGLAAASTTTTVTGAQGNATVTDNSLTFQIGANANQTVKVAVDNATTTALGLNVAGTQFANLNAIDVQSQSGAQDAIKVIDQAISDITNLRGRLGAVQQQTLESNANNLRTTLENTTAAESVIRDTDFAAETANFSKSQVLMQVGTQVLQNSNQINQLVLSLMRG
ncbi:MAG: flagellin [Gemmataceae bacterium]